MSPTRRDTTLGAAAAALAAGLTSPSRAAPAEGTTMTDATTADLIVIKGRVTTLDRSAPEAEAFAIKDGRFLAVGRESDVMAHRGPQTKVVDLKGRRVLPGLIDNHLHLIRGGLNFNMELRWDGVPSLKDAMDILRAQVAITPPPQWVRVVGGFTETQFAEKRLPTIEELNQVAPETPVFILHLYDRALLNGAALRAVGYGKDTPNPPGGEITRDAGGNPTGLLIAKPNATILYATLSKGPKLPFEYQVNSTRHFMRDLNRLGLTGALDAGGGSQNYPDDYAVIQKLADDGQLTVRLAYNLFTQKPKQEKEDFVRWTQTSKYKQGDDYFRHNGAGEMLVFSAADFEDFRQPRPDMPAEMEGDLEGVVRVLAENRWPWRLHATYDETISRALDVFEKVDRDIPLKGLNWFFDHAETISERSIDRVAALGGGVAVQHRMAYQGEFFVERYGPGAAEETPPFARMLDKGVKVSAGTDATRVASYNPWVSLSWLVTGRTVGGLALYPSRARLDRETALRMWTENVTWFSNEEGKKGRIAPGMLADFIVPDRDYFACAPDEISSITSDLTVVGGKVVYAKADFEKLDETEVPPAMPDWSPVRAYGGYGAWKAEAKKDNALRLQATACGCANACGVHGHDHARAASGRLPVADLKTFWGALGCACWAV
ncbi:amidohydrolase [Methylopila turkensis]|uniref:Amidohydrolase n=1 Tax=Methylopila turkensis TaxID=1437816 RepID=A0A9W6JKV5_9HYPH|nr:amidohydrolase [Methylopila turkensis]GLK78952.1 amidohydrolase [Methylopila turkensis]